MKKKKPIKGWVTISTPNGGIIVNLNFVKMCVFEDKELIIHYHDETNINFHDVDAAEFINGLAESVEV